MASDAVDRTYLWSSSHTYREILTEQGDFAWLESTEDEPIIHTKEPKTSWGRRFKVVLYGILAIEGQL